MNGSADVQTTTESTLAAMPPAKRQRLQRAMRDNQNLAFGVIGGFAAAALGAGLWAVVTVISNYQIGWMAVGVGVLVGLAVRYCGKGTDISFGVLGAGLSLLGCLAGNLLSVCIVVSREQAVGILDVLYQLDTAAVMGLMNATFSPMDLLFYGLAVYEGYRFSFRPVTGEEWANLTS